MMTAPARWTRRDDGVYAILYALFITIAVLLAALLIDINGMRQDRRLDKLATDAAALAGVAVMNRTLTPDAQAGCLAAWSYLQNDLGVSPSTGSIDCASAFPAVGSSGYTSCPSSPLIATGSLPDPLGDYQVQIEWPVPDTDPMMAPDIRPASSTLTQPAVQQDGTACQRFGVSITRTHNFLFVPGSAATANHSVALNIPDSGGGGVPAPLVILFPTGCDVLTAEGGGGIWIKSNDSVTPGYPGVIAVNSDGSGCSGQQTVVDSNSSSGNSNIWAQDSTTGGKAAILLYELLTGNNDGYKSSEVTCTSASPPSGQLCPQPTALSGQISRAFMDYQYNCTVVSTCAADDPHAGISQLDTFYNGLVASNVPPSGWTTVSGGACNSAASSYTGDVYVNCPNNFVVSGATDFTGADMLVFTGNVKVKSGGCLLFDVPAASVTTECTSSTQLSPAASDGPVVYINGQLNVGSGATLVAPQTFIREGDCTGAGTTCSTPANLGIQAGSSGGALWSAPLGVASCVPAQSATSWPSAGCFAKLALWNEYATPTNNPDTLNGQAVLFLQGTFFTPNGQVNLAGGNTADIRDAQFITGALNVNGGGLLTMIPDTAHTNPVPLSLAILIR
jgi:hypothetical protein